MGSLDPVSSVSFMISMGSVTFVSCVGSMQLLLTMVLVGDAGSLCLMFGFRIPQESITHGTRPPLKDFS